MAGYDWHSLARALSLDLNGPSTWLTLGIDPDLLPGLRAASRRCVEELEPLRKAAMDADPDNYIGPLLRRSQFEAALREVGADSSGPTLQRLEAIAWELGLAPSETHDEDRWWLVFLRLASPLKKTPPWDLEPERKTAVVELINRHLLVFPDFRYSYKPRELRKLSRWDRNLLAGEMEDAGFCPTLNFSGMLPQVGTRRTWDEVVNVLTPGELESLIEWGRLVEESELTRALYTPLDKPTWDHRPRVPADVQDTDQSEWRIDLGPGPYRNPEDAFKIPSLDGIRTHISRLDVWRMYVKAGMRWLIDHRPKGTP